MKPLKIFCAFCTVLAVLTAEPRESTAAIGPTFIARVKLDLCPEYRQGNVVYDVVYTIGTDPTLRTPEIVAQSVDSNTNIATVDIRFPTAFGATPFTVSSSCRNAFGFSDPSNRVSVSNCDAIARNDSDLDGVFDNLEDSNCDNFFGPQDASNADNVDTDGDGVRDLVEIVSGTSRTNPGSSPRPFVSSSAPFDPDGNQNANSVVWRPATGTWFIRDFASAGNTLAVQFGRPNDIPFAYQPRGLTSSVGVIRRMANDYRWFFYGAGFQRQGGRALNTLTLGVFGDNIIAGPWEQPGVTNPAVARVFNGVWTFIIYLSDGSTRSVIWGRNGDLPKVDDYDGDGIFDVAVYRPSESMTYAISSLNGALIAPQFGSGTSELTVRGDYSGDGKAEISYWEPANGVFSSLLSEGGVFQMQLGLYNVHLPLNWNRQGGKLLYTVVDHASGFRFFRQNNDPNGQIDSLQWGLPGDSQG